MDELDLSQMAQAAVGLHEVFKTLVEAGFNEDQALKLLGAMLANINRG